MVEAGKALGLGAFHAAGTVHGPHESRGGAKVLTMQQWQSCDGRFDFHLAEERERPVAGPPSGGTAAALPLDPAAPNSDTHDAEQATS